MKAIKLLVWPCLLLFCCQAQEKKNESVGSSNESKSITRKALVPLEIGDPRPSAPTPSRFIIGITAGGKFYWRQDVGDSAKHFVSHEELKVKVDQHRANYSDCEFNIDPPPEPKKKNTDSLLAELKVLRIDKFLVYPTFLTK